jgi:small multidrug resistance pump
MSWLFLLLAISFEVGGTTCMKLAEGFTKLIPSILVFLLYGLSLAALTVALKRIDVSIAYAVWSGLGTAAIATIGIVWFGEPVGYQKVICLAVIVAGVVGLNLNGVGR